MENEKIVVRDTTVDKAVSKGLAQLNLGSHEVDIKIISEGKKGLFGFGQKDAEVELTKYKNKRTRKYRCFRK